MRRLFTAGLISVIAMVAVACSGTTTTADPYQLAFNAKNAGWDQVQVDLALSVQNGSDSINLQPGAVRLVVDTKAGKGLFHVSLPVSALVPSVVPSASDLAQFGVTGDTIDLDVLWDGSALYVKSPLAPSLVTLLMASTGGTAPQGDLTGWLKLATAADFASLGALAGGAGGAAGASTAPMASIGSAADLKAVLTDAGVTLTYVGTEQHAGTNADHLSVQVDWQKLAASGAATNPSTQAEVQQVISAAQNATFTIDLWLDHSSSRIIAVEVK